MNIYDLVIIGGGPIGLACALEAEKKKLSYIILEKGTIANSLYHYPLYMRFFSSADRLEIDGIPFITTAPKPGRQEALEYYQGITRQRNINIHLYEKVTAVTKENDLFKIVSSKSEYTAKNVILATGFYDIPNRIHVKGEELPKVKHYYSEPYPYSKQKVVVVGASNSSVDAALEIYRKGGDVTMIVRGSEIGRRVKYWVRPDIENRITEGCIKAYFNSEITEIKENTVVFRDENDNTVEIENDFVLALTGYLPDFEFLDKTGVLLEGESMVPHHSDHTMETNVPGLYLAGVVCGGRNTHLWFIENSRIHAQIIMNAIVAKKLGVA
ncbi:YpdA family putative bacillithiol disulfide reductase [Elizabethkingia meningoseptica]|uniref:YpdA family putative bacillithiol disulfide reductase n=1 Tax=Elizabethkingia meningoseptica TaxID=238 RepID=UPI002DD6A71F|nr:YpdA family putative bacillithiol disulfide reductase [Elizabethkingia meningoseptica]MEC4713347.1 YpdA family putative bacillithiol disulfide reductase [Elizabethkingia meningoseptica]